MKSFLTLGILLAPCMGFAAHTAQHTGKDFAWVVKFISGIVGQLIILIFALTFMVIVWKVLKSWVIDGGESPEGAKQVVIAGIIAFVIMSSIWGILYLLRTSIFGS